MKSCAWAARRRLDDLLVGRVGPAVGDVVADGAGEDERVLLHDGDARSAARASR